MKLGNSTILAIVAATCFSIAALAMGKGRSGAAHMNQSNHLTGTALASTNVKTSPTPPGHHYG